MAQMHGNAHCMSKHSGWCPSSLLLLTSLIGSHGTGSFGAMDPASHDLYMFLEKLQEQQKEVINLIKERQRIIAERDGTPLPAPPVFVPGGSPAPPLPAAALKEKAVSPACEWHTQPQSLKLTLTLQQTLSVTAINWFQSDCGAI